MRKLEVIAGTTIEEAARKAILLARHWDEPVGFTFNGIYLDVDRESKPHHVVSTFHKQMEEESEAYRNSTEGKVAAALAEQRKKAMQERADQLMEDLDWMSSESVTPQQMLRWLRDIGPASDYIGVNIDIPLIIVWFRLRGHEPGQETGDDFQKHDRISVFRYLVGQCLSNLKSIGAIHQVIYGLWIPQWLRSEEVGPRPKMDAAPSDAP